MEDEVLECKLTEAERREYLLASGSLTRLSIEQLKKVLGKHAINPKMPELNTWYGNELRKLVKQLDLTTLDNLFMCRNSLEHTFVGGNSKVELVKLNGVIQWRDSANLSKSRDERARAEVLGKLHKNSSVELVSMREFTEELLQLADKFLRSINRGGRLEGLKEKLRSLSTGEPVALATFVDEDEALEQGMRMSRSLRGVKSNRPELADLRAKLEVPSSPAGLGVSAVPEISVGPRVLVHGDQGQGKTVLAEAAFLELQELRVNYDADFHRFRASSEQGDS